MQATRLAVVVLLSLLPWPAVWFGMYKLDSILWTFFLYHGVCLLPAAIWGRRLWLPHVIAPTGKQWLTVVVAAALSCIVFVGASTVTGDMIVSHADVMKVLTVRGFKAAWLVPFSLYFVLVNATLEELFWRGVVLNELDYVEKRYRYAGDAWTALTFSAWHWLVLRVLIKPGWAELAVAGVTVMGVFTSWLYRRTESIVVAILWHALVFDLAIIAMLVALLRAR